MIMNANLCCLNSRILVPLVIFEPVLQHFQRDETALTQLSPDGPGGTLWPSCVGSAILASAAEVNCGHWLSAAD
jgi:hypothetical protein